VVAGVSRAGFWNAADTAAVQSLLPRHFGTIPSLWEEKRRRKLLQSVKNMLWFSPLWLF
jgi:hypothetical protein